MKKETAEALTELAKAAAKSQGWDENKVKFLVCLEDMENICKDCGIHLNDCACGLPKCSECGFYHCQCHDENNEDCECDQCIALEDDKYDEDIIDAIKFSLLTNS